MLLYVLKKKTSVLPILSASCLCSVKKETDTNNYWFQNSWNRSNSLSWCSPVKRHYMLKWWIHQWALLVNIPLKVSCFGGLTVGVFRIALALTARLTLSFLPYPLSACQRWEGFLYRPQFQAWWPPWRSGGWQSCKAETCPGPWLWCWLSRPWHQSCCKTENAQSHEKLAFGKLPWGR